MSKIGIFADLHLGVRKNDEKWYKVALDWADWFIAECRKEGVRDIVFLGDFFHKRETISTRTLHVAAEFLEKFKDDFHLHIILGNHDLFYKDIYDVSGVNLFAGYPYITVYKTPQMVEFGGKKCLMCGWGYNPLEYKAEYLFTHAEINTFHFESGAICEEDLKCSDLLQNFKHVISGHFHTQQAKNYDFGSVEFLGAPYSMDFHDEGKKKYVMILDIDKDERRLVEYKNSPRFVSYLLSDLLLMDSTASVVEEVKGSFCRVKIDKNISVEDENELNRLFSLCAPIEYRTEYLLDDKIDIRRKKIEFFSIPQAIKEYVTEVISIPDAERVTNYLINLYTQVSESNV